MHQYIALATQSSFCAVRHPSSSVLTLWPANSSDLNPVDYRIWGMMQERVYRIEYQSVFTARRYVSAIYAVILYPSVWDGRIQDNSMGPSVSPSVCLSQVGVLRRRLYL